MLCRHVDDRIHMNFLEKPTDTQDHSAHTCEVSLWQGNTTGGVRLALKPNYFPPHMAELSVHE